MEQDLKNRLEDELGRPYIDIEDGFEFGTESELTFIVPSERAREIIKDHILVIYDLRTEIWYGAKVKGIEILQTGTPDRERDLFGIDDEKLVEKFNTRQESYEDPAIVTVEAVSLFEDGQRKAPARCPSSASVLMKPKIGETDVDGEPTLKDVLGLPAKGLTLGSVSLNQNPYSEDTEDGTRYIQFDIDQSELSNKHIAVFGDSGTGKTSFLKFSSNRLADQGYGIIFFDVQGDIFQVYFDMEDEQKEELEGFHEDFHDQIDNDPGLPEDVEKTLYFPMTDDVDEEEKNEIEDLCEKAGVEFTPFSIKFRNVTSAGELNYFLSSVSSEYAIDIADTIVSSTNKTLDEVTTIIENSIDGLEDTDQVSVPRLGINTPQYVSSYRALLRGLANAENSGMFDADPSAAEPEVFGNAGEYNVVYFDHLDEEWKRNLIEKHIMEKMRVNKTEVDKPGIYIILDEAHEIIPQKASPGTPKEIVDRLAFEFDKMARVGRKYDINLLVSTHYPSDINDIVKKQCDTKVVLGLSENEARDAGVPKEYREDVSQLNRGFGYINTKSSRTSPWTEVKIPLTNLNHMQIDPWDERMEELQTEARDETVTDEMEEMREEM